ncbi:MAG: hypothetical protein K5697_16940 [Lachnospiraceae bacterium]|nr:hypothetical protein [Lachnospiraceae bacterium]
MKEGRIHRLIMHTYAYTDERKGVSKLLVLAYLLDDGVIRVMDMSKENGFLPRDLQKALRCPWTIKYAVDPVKEMQVLRAYTKGIEALSDENWMPVDRILGALGLPPDLYETARMLRLEPGFPEKERSCVERFCMADPVFGKTVAKEDFPFQWEEMKQVGGWYVRTIMSILWKFNKAVKPRMRLFRLRDSFRRISLPLDEELLDSYCRISAEKIEENVLKYNETAEAKSDDPEELLYRACKLKQALNTDFEKIRQRTRNGWFRQRELKEDAEDGRVTMLFRVSKLKQNEELLLLDYRKTSHKALLWLAGLKTDDGEALERWKEEFRISLWQTVHLNKRCICGKIKMLRRGFWLLFFTPCGSGPVLMNPVFSCRDEEWYLSCDEYAGGSRKRAEYITDRLLEMLAEYTTEAYMAEFADRIAPRRQMLLCEQREMLLKLEKGILFHTRMMTDIRQKWWYGLTLTPEILYRTGGRVYE